MQPMRAHSVKYEEYDERNQKRKKKMKSHYTFGE